MLAGLCSVFLSELVESPFSGLQAVYPIEICSSRQFHFQKSDEKCVCLYLNKILCGFLKA